MYTGGGLRLRLALTKAGTAETPDSAVTTARLQFEDGPRQGGADGQRFMDVDRAPWAVSLLRTIPQAKRRMTAES